MKRLYAIIMFLLPVQLNAQVIDTLLHERFETGGLSFTLNTSDMGSVNAATGYNQWIINNAYAGGSGTLVCIGFPFSFNVAATPSQPQAITGGTNTNYMHMVSDAAQASGINNCCYLAADGICNFNESNFTAMNQDVNTSGYDSVTVSFLWLCAGGTNIYGELYYSTNGGTSWSLVTTPLSQYRNQSNWTQQSITIPAFAGQSSLRFGFRFVNQTSNTANDPGFGIDEFMIQGKVAGPPLAASFGVSDPELCGSGCVDFTDLSTGSPTSWLWIFQGAATAFSTQQHPLQICYTSPGTYDVTLIAGNSSGTDTLTLPGVIVHPNPVQPVITLSGDTLFTTPGFAGYQWYLNNNIIAGATADYHVVLADGNYTVVVTDSNGCSSESLPLSFTTGLTIHESSTVNFYPNPATDYIVAERAGRIEKITVYSITGELVSVFYPDGNPAIKMNISNLENGCYLLGIYEKDGTTGFRKLIKF